MGGDGPAGMWGSSRGWKREHAMLLDFDPDVVGLASQPFALRLSGQKSVTYTPGNLARRAACHMHTRCEADGDWTQGIDHRASPRPCFRSAQSAMHIGCRDGYSGLGMQSCA